jgi:transcriptional regulator GlxA family with amidase domain
MQTARPEKVQALILALPETAGSALYGMVDVLAATGTLWSELVGEPPGAGLIEPRIIGRTLAPFLCGNAIPVAPQLDLASAGSADLVILPEMWLGPHEDPSGRYPDVVAWVRARHAVGSHIYAACSGTVLLAATGLLDGCAATSHWGYADLFRTRFPKVRFRPEPNLVFADAAGRIVTAGGTTSWHDLALYIIARHASPGEALRIAKIYLMKWHDEGQLPYASLVRRQPHADAAVRRAEESLRRSFRSEQAVEEAVSAGGIPERTLKRRFRAATGTTLIAYVQNLRIEEAKRLLEQSEMPVDEIAAETGYENAAFFRRLFRRLTGLPPGDYRRMFQRLPEPLPLAPLAPTGSEPRLQPAG